MNFGGTVRGVDTLHSFDAATGAAPAPGIGIGLGLLAVGAVLILVLAARRRVPTRTH